MERAAAAPHDFSISKCPPNCVVSKVLSPIEPSRLSDYNLPSSILNLWPTRRPGCSHPGCRPLVLRCGSGSGRNVHRSGNYSRCRYTPSRRCIAAASAPPSAPVFRRSRTTPSAVLSVLGYEHQSIFMAPESAPCSLSIARTPVYTKAKASSALLPGALG